MPTENWFDRFNSERVHGLRHGTLADMTTMSFEYIEVFYNRKRQHSTLGYKSPMQFLDDWFTVLRACQSWVKVQPLCEFLAAARGWQAKWKFWTSGAAASNF